MEDLRMWQMSRYDCVAELRQRFDVRFLSQHVADALEGCDEKVTFLDCVVDSE